MEGLTETNDYMSIKDFCKKYPNIVTPGSLRWIILNSTTTNADYFFRRLGKRKLYISEKRFFEWVNSRTPNFNRAEGHAAVGQGEDWKGEVIHQSGYN